MFVWIAVLSAVAGVVLVSRLAHIEIKAGGRVRFQDFKEFSAQFSNCFAAHMQTHYSGNPLQLEEALSGFLPIARQMASAQPEPIDDDVLRTMIVTAVVTHRLARRDEVEAVMNSILATEERAAA